MGNASLVPGAVAAGSGQSVHITTDRGDELDGQVIMGTLVDLTEDGRILFDLEDVFRLRTSEGDTFDVINPWACTIEVVDSEIPVDAGAVG